jgi:hypothetical protein
VVALSDVRGPVGGLGVCRSGGSEVAAEPIPSNRQSGPNAKLSSLGMLAPAARSRDGDLRRRIEPEAFE